MGLARHHECEAARVLGLGEPSERSARRRYALPAEIPDVTAVRVRFRTDENIRIDELEILGVAVIEAGQNIAGDCNQDGEFDLSDVVCLLGHLFQGNPGELPCETTAANLALMDCNQDDSIDLSDAIYKLAFLFQGGPPPELGTVCFGIPQCPENEGCP
jgi:hypothetical protein